MKIIVCAWGKVGLGNIIKLQTYYSNANLFVYTYERKNNIELIKYLKNQNIPYSFQNINLCLQEVMNFKPDYIVSAYYRHIIKKEILEIPKDTINVHPSLLPKYKGRYVGFWTIYNEEEYTGITYHRMDPKVDSGQIYLQEKIKISKKDTAYSIYLKNSYLAIDFFIEAFEKMLYQEKTYPQKGKSTIYMDKSFPFECKISANCKIEKITTFCKAAYFPGKKGATIYEGEKEITIEGYPDREKIINAIKIIKGGK